MVIWVWCCLVMLGASSRNYFNVWHPIPPRWVKTWPGSQHRSRQVQSSGQHGFPAGHCRVAGPLEHRGLEIELNSPFSRKNAGMCRSKLNELYIYIYISWLIVYGVCVCVKTCEVTYINWMKLSTHLDSQPIVAFHACRCGSSSASCRCNSTTWDSCVATGN